MQQSVPVIATRYTLLLKVMFCDREPNSSWLINNTESIPLSLWGNATERAIQHAKGGAKTKSFWMHGVKCGTCGEDGAVR